MDTRPHDPIWDDLAALAFELTAKPDDRTRAPADHDRRAEADKEEGEP